VGGEVRRSEEDKEGEGEEKRAKRRREEGETREGDEETNAECRKYFGGRRDRARPPSLFPAFFPSITHPDMDRAASWVPGRPRMHKPCSSVFAAALTSPNNVYAGGEGQARAEILTPTRLVHGICCPT
jgi:hypothetical protein